MSEELEKKIARALARLRSRLRGPVRPEEVEAGLRDLREAGLLRSAPDPKPGGSRREEA